MSRPTVHSRLAYVARGYRFTLAAAVLAIFLPMLPATDAQSFERRFYAGVGGGFSQLEPNPRSTGYEVVESGDNAVRGFVGWDYSPRWSLEGFYSGLGAAGLEQQAGQSLTPPSGTIDYTAYGISALAYFFSFDDAAGLLGRTGLSLYAGFGVGVLDTSSSNLPMRQLEDVQLTLSAGAEYGLENGFAARANLIGFDRDAIAVTLQLLYRFGEGPDTSRTRVTETKPVETVQAETPVVQPQPVPQQQPITTAPLDSDSDGVPDNADVCVNTAYGVPVNDSGCPLFDGRIEGVGFQPGSEQLTTRATEILNGVAAQLLAYPSVRVAIMAHTDNKGSAQSNLQLSKARALSVARFLVSRGIDRNRLQPEAYGESRPVATNVNAAGRELNRRVEFRTLE